MSKATPELTLAGQLSIAARGQGWLQVAEERVTWAELLERAQHIAGGLAGLGVERGARVATILPNRLEQVELLFAAAVSGAVLVPVSPYLRGAFLHHHLVDSDPLVVIGDAAGLTASQPYLADLPGLQAIVAVENPCETVAAVPYAQLRAAAWSRGAVLPQPADTVALLFTSGTTGESKACVCSNAYYINTGLTVAEAWAVGADDVYFTALPLHHGAGQVAALMTALVRGASFCAPEAFRASMFIAQARACGATLSSGVGAMARALLARPPASDDRGHRLRLVLMSPLDVASQEAFTTRFGVPLSPQAYGQTECIGVTITPAEQFGRPSRTVGPPSPLFEVAIHDADGHAVPTGASGEIVVRPRRPGVMFDGYWRRPEATLDAFRGLWHHTGDVGFSTPTVTSLSWTAARTPCAVAVRTFRRPSWKRPSANIRK
jgi:crotonobetaine/carnitine-CoA ligase